MKYTKELNLTEFDFWSGAKQHYFTSSDFKASEVEIGYCTVDQPRFRKLAENEIENILNDLADK